MRVVAAMGAEMAEAMAAEVMEAVAKAEEEKGTEARRRWRGWRRRGQQRRAAAAMVGVVRAAVETEEGGQRGEGAG